MSYDANLVKSWIKQEESLLQERQSRFILYDRSRTVSLIVSISILYQFFRKKQMLYHCLGKPSMSRICVNFKNLGRFSIIYTETILVKFVCLIVFILYKDFKEQLLNLLSYILREIIFLHIYQWWITIFIYYFCFGFLETFTCNCANVYIKLRGLEPPVSIYTYETLALSVFKLV